MSASLVGSEMCIRDRLRRVMLVTAPVGELRAVQLVAARPEGAWQVGVRPVSYTHLTLPTICSV
eukprot:7385399-Alexandrium_andersonii.AAC.1